MMNKLKFYISNVLIVSTVLLLSSSTAFAKSANKINSNDKYNVKVKSIIFPSTEDGKISDPTISKEFDSASSEKKSLNDFSVKVDIFPEVCFQKIYGVGGCFNEIGCLEFQALPKDKRLQVMHNLFSRDGAGFSFCRTAIGSSDFGKDAYSYDDFAEDYKMEHFSVKRDLKSIIPSIQEAYDVNPDLKMFASPWSPPFWMKVSQRMEGNDTQTEDSMKKNTMIDLPQIKQAYALYMSKYIQAYSKYGINIDRLCPQNETDANPKYPSNIMSTSFMSDLITNYFCPQFVKDNIKTEIWAGTFRVAKYKKGHFEAIKIINDDSLFNYIGGLGVQYTSPTYLNDLRQARPNLKMMHTEGICYNGENTIAQAKSRLEEIAGYINAGVENYAYWNIFLDKPQQSGWGWKQNSLITIDAINDSVVYNPDYKVVSLISDALRPGDVRCANFLSSSDPIISVLAPNGDIKVLIKNNYNNSKKVRLSISEDEFHYVVLPANSLNSIILKINF